MKRMLLAVIGACALALPINSAHAQSAVGTRLSDYGGFVGLDLRFGNAADKFAAFAGGEAAVLLKRRVYLGVRGSGLATDNIRLPQGSGTDELSMGYGGVMVGYIVGTPALVDVSVDVLVGAGAAGIGDENANNEWDPIFVFEPSATVDVKLTRFARIGVGGAYRFVGDLEVAGVREADVRGFTGLVRVRAGWF